MPKRIEKEDEHAENGARSDRNDHRRRLYYGCGTSPFFSGRLSWSALFILLALFFCVRIFFAPRQKVRRIRGCAARAVSQCGSRGESGSTLCGVRAMRRYAGGAGCASAFLPSACVAWRPSCRPALFVARDKGDRRAEFRPGAAAPHVCILVRPRKICALAPARRGRRMERRVVCRHEYCLCAARFMRSRDACPSPCDFRRIGLFGDFYLRRRHFKRDPPRGRRCARR